MDPLTMGLITGGANLLGSIFSSDTSAQNTQAQIAAQQGMQKQSEDFNASQAQISRDYSTSMSNTAYQRSAADMKAAGLNPMMMFGSGGAASTPSSPTASIGTPTVPVSQSKGALSGIGDAVNKGLDAAINAKTIDKMSEEIANLKASGLKTVAETKTEEQKPSLVQAETDLHKSSARNVDQDTLGKKLDRARQEWEATKYLDLSGIPDSIRKTANITSWGGKKLDDVIAPLIHSAFGSRFYFSNH